MCSFRKKELQINQREHKRLLPQTRFAALTHDFQITPMLFLVKHEALLPSQKEDCHPITANFGNAQFSLRIKDMAVENSIKPADSISFHPVEPFQSL